MTSFVLGFNGERLEPVSGSTLLGNGYRAYTSALMRFKCPDSWSPFGDGGINAYVLCADDPVNRSDPSGHFSPGDWLGLGVGLLAGIALGILTEGAAMPAVLALTATVTGEGAIGAGAELVSEAVDGRQINWAAIGISAGTSAAMSLVGFGAGRVAAKGVKRAGRFVKDWQNKLQHAGGARRLNTLAPMNDAGLLEKEGGFRRPLYRADEMPPDYILKHGFRPSTDFTATGKCMNGIQPTLIVAERLEGAIRYNAGALGGRGHIYMIKGDKIRGTSLIDNMWNNRVGLTNFFDDSTLSGESLSDVTDTIQGANYLSEAHVYHADVMPEMISIVPESQARQEPVPGRWKNWF